MGDTIVTLIFLAIGFVIGLLLFINVYKKHKRIDTESIAEVVEVKYLGRDDGRKAYGIKYIVRCSEPYEFWITPTKKALDVGTKRTIFFEKASPKRNYFFKKRINYDSRFIIPLFLMIGCAVAELLTIYSILFR